MTQLARRNQITSKWSDIGQSIAFNNKKHPYHIVSYKGKGNDKREKINKKTAYILYPKQKTKNKYGIMWQKKHTELTFTWLGNYHIQNDGVKRFGAWYSKPQHCRNMTT